MSKPKVSLEAIAARQAATSAGENVVTLKRDDVKVSRKAGHTSLYLHPAVRKAIREIAFQFDRKPHDLYLEGIDMMLTKYSKPSVAELSK